MITRPAMPAVAEVASRLGAASTTSTPSSPWRGDAAHELERLAAREAAGRRAAGARCVGGVERVDVEGQVDRRRCRSRRPRCARSSGPCRAALPDLLEPDDRDPVLAAVGAARCAGSSSREMPSSAILARVEAGVDRARDRAAVVQLLAADVRRGVEVRVDEDEARVVETWRAPRERPGW